MKDRSYKVGEVVFANHVIVRREPFRIVAIHGQLGVVITISEPYIWVRWAGGSEAPVFAKDVNPYQGHVEYRQ